MDGSVIGLNLPSVAAPLPSKSVASSSSSNNATSLARNGKSRTTSTSTTTTTTTTTTTANEVAVATTATATAVTADASTQQGRGRQRHNSGSSGSSRGMRRQCKTGSVSSSEAAAAAASVAADTFPPTSPVTINTNRANVIQKTSTTTTTTATGSTSSLSLPSSPSTVSRLQHLSSSSLSASTNSKKILSANTSGSNSSSSSSSSSGSKNKSGKSGNKNKLVKGCNNKQVEQNLISEKEKEKQQQQEEEEEETTKKKEQQKKKKKKKKKKKSKTNATTTTTSSLDESSDADDEFDSDDEQFQQKQQQQQSSYLSSSSSSCPLTTTLSCSSLSTLTTTTTTTTSEDQGSNYSPSDSELEQQKNMVSINKKKKVSTVRCNGITSISGSSSSSNEKVMKKKQRKQAITTIATTNTKESSKSKKVSKPKATTTTTTITSTGGKCAKTNRTSSLPNSATVVVVVNGLKSKKKSSTTTTTAKLSSAATATTTSATTTTTSQAKGNAPKRKRRRVINRTGFDKPRKRNRATATVTATLKNKSTNSTNSNCTNTTATSSSTGKSKSKVPQQSSSSSQLEYTTTKSQTESRKKTQSNNNNNATTTTKNKRQKTKTTTTTKTNKKSRKVSAAVASSSSIWDGSSSTEVDDNNIVDSHLIKSKNGRKKLPSSFSYSSDTDKQTMSMVSSQEEEEDDDEDANANKYPVYMVTKPSSVSNIKCSFRGKFARPIKSNPFSRPIPSKKYYKMSVFNHAFAQNYSDELQNDSKLIHLMNLVKQASSDQPSNDVMMVDQQQPKQQQQQDVPNVIQSSSSSNTTNPNPNPANPTTSQQSNAATQVILKRPAILEHINFLSSDDEDETTTTTTSATDKEDDNEEEKVPNSKKKKNKKLATRFMQSLVRGPHSELTFDLWYQYQYNPLPRAMSSANYRRVRQNVFVNTKPVAKHSHQSCSCKAPRGTGTLGCGSDCINRMMYQECWPQTCPVGTLCSNQRIQRYEWSPGLVRFMTTKRGWGICTTEFIKGGEFILEYIGEIVSENLFKKRMTERYGGHQHHYSLKIDSGILIDGYRVANEGRFVNHSCDPNCEMQKWAVLGYYRICLFALRDIEPGEELFYDYNFHNFNLDSQQICHCGSENCRGFIGGKKVSPKAFTNTEIGNYSSYNNNGDGDDNGNGGFGGDGSESGVPFDGDDRGGKALQHNSSSFATSSSSKYQRKHRYKLSCNIKWNKEHAFDDINRFYLFSPINIENMEYTLYTPRNATIQIPIAHQLATGSSSSNGSNSGGGGGGTTTTTTTTSGNASRRMIASSLSSTTSSHQQNQNQQQKKCHTLKYNSQLVTFAVNSKPPNHSNRTFVSRRGLLLLRNYDYSRQHYAMLHDCAQRRNKSEFDLNPYLKQKINYRQSPNYSTTMTTTTTNQVPSSAVTTTATATATGILEHHHHQQQQLECHNNFGTLPLETMTVCRPLPNISTMTMVELDNIITKLVQHAQTFADIYKRIKTFLYDLLLQNGFNLHNRNLVTSSLSSSAATDDCMMIKSINGDRGSVKRHLELDDGDDCCSPPSPQQNIIESCLSYLLERIKSTPFLRVNQQFEFDLQCYARRQLQLLLAQAKQANNNSAASKQVISNHNNKKMKGSNLADVGGGGGGGGDGVVQQSNNNNDVSEQMTMTTTTLQDTMLRFINNLLLEKKCFDENMIMMLLPEHNNGQLLDLFSVLPQIFHRNNGDDNGDNGDGVNLRLNKENRHKMARLIKRLENFDLLSSSSKNQNHVDLIKLFSKEEEEEGDDDHHHHDQKRDDDHKNNVAKLLQNNEQKQQQHSIGNEDKKIKQEEQHNESLSSVVNVNNQNSLTTSPLEEVIRCICTIPREEGKMIQCDHCQIWQHYECIEQIFSLGQNGGGGGGSSSSSSSGDGEEYHEEYLCDQCRRVEAPLDIPLPKANEPNLDVNSQYPLKYYTTLESPVIKGLRIRVDDCVYIYRQSNATMPLKTLLGGGGGGGGGGKKVNNNNNTSTTPINGETSAIKSGGLGGGTNFLDTISNAATAAVRNKNHPFVRRECIIIRVQHLAIIESTGQRILFGHHYLWPSETYHEPSRKFYENEVLRSPLCEWAALEEVRQICTVLDPATYVKGKPKNFNTEDVFICEFRVDRAAKSFSRIPKAKHLTINTKPYAFDTYANKLTIKRTYSPHNIPQEYVSKKVKTKKDNNKHGEPTTTTTTTTETNNTNATTTTTSSSSSQVGGGNVGVGQTSLEEKVKQLKRQRLLKLTNKMAERACYWRLLLEQEL